jgi:hypothetical protein
VSSAQVVQSSKTSAGVRRARVRASFWALVSRPVIALAGEGRVSCSSRRVPRQCATRCSAGVPSTFTPTEDPSSTSAGKPRTAPEETSRGSVPTSQVVIPVRSTVRGGR